MKKLPPHTQLVITPLRGSTVMASLFYPPYEIATVTIEVDAATTTFPAMVSRVLAGQQQVRKSNEHFEAAIGMALTTDTMGPKE